MKKNEKNELRFPTDSFLNEKNSSLPISAFLSLSYQDAWEDYKRSLIIRQFPVWDYIVLTASNEHQAETFREQLNARKEFLPTRTKFIVIPDERGKRVGSGGATLSVLKNIRAREDTFSGLRIMVIHSGGDSKRIPQYSALGKLFSPVPHILPDGRSSALFDELMIAMAAVPGRIREGMLLLSGDVQLLFNPLLIDYSGHGAAAISFKEKVETGKDHGVYLRSEDGYLQSFLHKQTVEKLRSLGAVNEAGAVDIDTGALIFGTDVLEALYSLISTDGKTDHHKYEAIVNEKVRLSLYGDLQYPMAADSTLEQFYREKPEGECCDELLQARKAVWDVLRPFRMKVLRLAPAKFIHMGTTAEVLQLINHDIGEYAALGWKRSINSSTERCACYNSVLSSKAQVGLNCYLEVSYVHSGAFIGDRSVLSYIDIHDGEIVPSDVVVHGLKQANGKFVCRIFGTKDNPKENRIFGHLISDDKEGKDEMSAEFENEIWDKDVEHNLWNAKLYPECNTIKEAVYFALELHRLVAEGHFSRILTWKSRKSLCAGFIDADSAAILEWNRRMEQLVQLNRIEERILDGASASEVSEQEGILTRPLSKIQQEWIHKHLEKADYKLRMRLHYYLGTVMRDESEVASTFRVLQKAILDETLAGLQENLSARIVSDHCEVTLPLRVNWGGGWSDTPPYCNENGGTVLNAAIMLKGERPVKVSLHRIEEKKVVFDSRDMDIHGEFDTITPLQKMGDPFDPFVLQKAALLACGIIPAAGGSLNEVLQRLGGGFQMNSEVTGVPKGSGLGTSSILAAACVKAIFEFMGIQYSEDELYAHVLCMEQIMSTGGGWQDQVGGVTDGIKYITSSPGLKQILKVEHLSLNEQIQAELNERFALIYTGQRRLARNLLRDVVGRYIGNEPEAVQALNEIQRVAALMRFELERGHVDDFAGLLSKHWELSKQIDAGSSNTVLDQILISVDDLIAGKMVCGAGGGGFLQVILKKGCTRQELQKRLQTVFEDTEIRVWDCTLV